MQSKESFLSRFYQYQKERFPFLGHGILIGAFSFSAISYSRLCRGLDTFIDWRDYLHCIFITITLFFLLRIFDEHKDKEDDAQYRSYLPVPRGLISLQELKIVGIITFILQVAVIAIWQTSLLTLFIPIIIYMLLMGKEFFVAEWLKERPFWYVVSHMFIIPFVDIYASSYDWKLSSAGPPIGLIFFFAVSFLNGIVLEIGRKIKTPATEEPGVKSYTFLLGTRRAIIVWWTVLTATLINAIIAWYYAHNSMTIYLILIILYIASLIPAILFYREINNVKYAKAVEITSIVWTIGMYICLGGGMRLLM
jgi:hypothetical protein